MRPSAMVGIVTFLIIVIFGGEAQAATAKADLFVWQYSESSARLILLRTGKQTYEDAAENYMKAFNQNKELRSLNEGRLKIKFDNESFAPLAAEKETGRPKFLVLVSDPIQAQGAVTNKNWYKGLKSAGADIYIMPVNPEIHLSPANAKLYSRLIANYFDGLLLLGGDDIDPKFYRQKNRKAEEVTSIRDKAELAIIRDYMKVGKGSVFGICRGMQALAVASGYPLVQDIDSDLKDIEIEHEGDDHLMRILPFKNSILRRAFGDAEVVKVNSYHHQAVDFGAKKNGPLVVVGRSVKTRKSDAVFKNDPEAQVVEALELKNGRGFGVQFHPERMLGSDVSRAVFKAMVRTAKAKSKIRRSCKANLSAEHDAA